MLSSVGERERTHFTSGTLGVYAHAVAYVCMQHHHTCQTISFTLQGNVCNCNRVPQCIYEMNVEILIHCTSSLYYITGTPFHCLLLLLDIENVWGCKTCDGIAECTVHCRTLLVGVTAVYLHQELLHQLLWLNRTLHCSLDIILHHRVE